MSDSLALSVQGVGKCYRLKRGGQASTTMAEALIQKVRGSGDSGYDEYWALRNVSFDVRAGEVVGLIGRNGAGKSTMLKLLSRITQPTEGTMKLYGRIGSLLEVGTGFHPELTGRENIYLNGAILGMRRHEIDTHFDDIVQFAGVERFLETPVKRYSSGMYVRLAFAVAAHLNPEILVVDEVLAVGDADFQRKCLDKMQDVANQGRTVLFVSHNMAVLQMLCTRGILLQNGTVGLDGTIEETVGAYLRSVERNAGTDVRLRTDRKGLGDVKLVSVDAETTGEFPSKTLAVGDGARFTFELDNMAHGLNILFTLYDHHGQVVTGFDSGMSGADDRRGLAIGSTFTCDISTIHLVPGRYRMNVQVSSSVGVQDHLEGALIIDVESGELCGRAVTPERSRGVLALPHAWTTPGE